MGLTTVSRGHCESHWPFSNPLAFRTRDGKGIHTTIINANSGDDNLNAKSFISSSFEYFCQSSH